MEDGAKDVGGRGALLAVRLTVGGIDLTVLGPLRRVQPPFYSGGDPVVLPSRRNSVLELNGAQPSVYVAHKK
jgi:hypothetical protein